MQNPRVPTALPVGVGTFHPLAASRCEVHVTAVGKAGPDAPRGSAQEGGDTCQPGGGRCPTARPPRPDQILPAANCEEQFDPRGPPPVPLTMGAAGTGYAPPPAAFERRRRRDTPAGRHVDAWPASSACVGGRSRWAPTARARARRKKGDAPVSWRAVARGRRRCHPPRPAVSPRLFCAYARLVAWSRPPPSERRLLPLS